MTFAARVKLRSIRSFAAIALGALIASCAHVSRDAGYPQPSAEQLAQAQCAPIKLSRSASIKAQRFDSGLPKAGQWRDGFDLADMNADGHVDLLHGPPRKGRAQPFIFLGDGAGHFEVWSEAHFPPLPYDYGDIKAADLNGDGRIDIAFSSHLRGLATLIHEAGGHYAPWGEGLTLRQPGEFPNEQTFSSRAIAVIDWNRDGKPDLLALNEGPSRFSTGAMSGEALALFLNRGGYWQRTEPTNALHSFGDALAVGDINGDHMPDAMIGTQFVGARLLLQVGDSETFSSQELRSLPRAAAVTAVALHDFDGDGRDEVVNASRTVAENGYCSALHVVMRRADRTETSVTLWREYSKDPVVSLSIADIDDDDHDELIALRQQGGIMIFAIEPNATAELSARGTAVGFHGATQSDPGLGSPPEMQNCQVFDSEVADLDGDGQWELIVSYAGEDAATGAFECQSGGGFLTWHLRSS